MYKETIKNVLKEKGLNADPRHIEGFMRLGNSTLDNLPLQAFKMEVMLGFYCIKEGGLENAENLARSFNL